MGGAFATLKAKILPLSGNIPILLVTTHISTVCPVLGPGKCYLGVTSISVVTGGVNGLYKLPSDVTSCLLLCYSSEHGADVHNGDGMPRPPLIEAALHHSRAIVYIIKTKEDPTFLCSLEPVDVKIVGRNPFYHIYFEGN